MLKQKTWLGIFFDMIFNHVVAQWSETTCFFMSKQALNSPNSKGVRPYAPTTSIKHPYCRGEVGGGVYQRGEGELLQ